MTFLRVPFCVARAGNRIFRVRMEMAIESIRHDKIGRQPNMRVLLDENLNWRLSDILIPIAT